MISVEKLKNDGNSTQAITTTYIERVNPENDQGETECNAYYMNRYASHVPSCLENIAI